MFSKVGGGSKNQFLEQTKAARAERAQGKERDKHATILQAHIRGFLTRRRFQKGLQTSINELLQIPENPEDEYKPKLLPALEVYKKIRQFFYVYSQEPDKRKLEFLCRYLLSSMDTEQIKLCYVSVALMKPYVVEWILQAKNIMWQSCSCLRTLRPENHTEMQSIMLHLRLLITFTSTSTWKILKGKTGEPLVAMMNQLCNTLMGNLNTKGMYPILQGLLTRGLSASKPAFKHASLSAVVTLALRPLIASNFSENLMNVFILHILSVPAIVCHMSNMSPVCLTQMVTHRIFKRSLDLLTNEQSTRIIFNSLEGNYALCLLANLVQLGYIELE
ncbi:ubiquitin-protein ligase E3B-like, partial [Mizuhopecten yessoensis]|uniref:ubiquitin-protein ligase E3B-like n=1 Tax=Mizuhopecten yessoensis TaxID=6573 RepID=UPI000B45ADB2